MDAVRRPKRMCGRAVLSEKNQEAEDCGRVYARSASLRASLRAARKDFFALYGMAKAMP
jgi:hypothetical protein